MMHTPARFLVLIESAGAMVARLFDARFTHLGDFDASSEEVAVMTSGVMPQRGVKGEHWGAALRGHSPEERAEALVFALDP
jgi:hypothetical protein